MKANMGSADRIIRIIIAAILFALYYMNIISGTLGVIMIVVSAVFVLTSFISFCPLYTILGISTKKKKENA
jgi:ABC-type bacteriocin/lantibiotic exporter with double-glycine peptidase domain